MRRDTRSRLRATGTRSRFCPTWPDSAATELFTDVDQLLAYAGVHPKEQSSGQKGANPDTSWTMAKTGNAYLRAAAYRMAVVGVLRPQTSRWQVGDERPLVTA